MSSPSSPQPPIHIPTSISNLYLRTPHTVPLNTPPASHSDAAALSRIFSHKHNTRFEPPRPGSSDTSADKYAGRIPGWLEAAGKGESCFALVCLRTGSSQAEAEGGAAEGEDAEGREEVIGFGGLNAVSTKPHRRSPSAATIRVANVGVMLHEPYTRRGLGKAVLIATIDAAFGMWGVDAVEADTMVVNTPFRGLMRAVGLEAVGEQTVDGEGREVVVYFLERGFWEGLREGKAKGE